MPWFVGWLDEDGKACRRGSGTPDFRVLYPNAIEAARAHSLCWICGRPLQPGIAYAFVIGPMCAINRVSAEPPSHIACADWAARACPFLTRPHMVRREGCMPEDAIAPAGRMLDRNPGVALVWFSKTAYAFPAPTGGYLFNVGEPVKVRFYREGRDATREEVEESITSGLPLLQEVAEEQSLEAVTELERMTGVAMELLPAA